MTLSVALSHHLKSFSINVAFDAPNGVTALFGRSGSGKTTLVNAVAGLLRPEQGRIALGDRVLFDANAGINLPTAHRKIGYVFQDARLFPHMSVARNLRYGGSHDADNIVRMLGLDRLLDRMPATLSGGEAQRVALARALMSEPDLLLMDEPLAALDGPRKAEILPYFERLRDRDDLPIVYVSHDIAEVARLATTLVVLEKGQTRAVGPLSEILSDPAHIPLFGEQDLGSVILGRVAGYDPRDGLSHLDFDGGQLVLTGRIGETGAKARVRIAASDVILATERPEGLSALNTLEARIVSLEHGAGPGVAVGLTIGATRILARVTRRSVHVMGLTEGRQVFAILKATAIAQSQSLSEDEP